MASYRSVLGIALTSTLILVTSAQADVPRLINYQGILTDTSGIPLDGLYDLTFTIYGDSIGTPPYFWSELHTSVGVDAGLFNVILGSTSPFPAGLFAIQGLGNSHAR